MNARLMTLAALVIGLAGGQAPAQSLNVGDASPPLTVGRYVKGEKIERLEPDQTYVVEFWATWCGPCIQTIPHLTELQKKYKDKGVKFIGVSVFEQDQDKVEPFVKKMGEKMEYSVAVDDVSKGEGAEGKMATAWMKASESEGIPTAFVVKNGKVAWIGHPSGMDPVLEKVVKPDFDLTKFASAAREEKAVQKRLMAVIQKINNLGDNATDKQRLAIIDTAITDDAAFEKTLGFPKYMMMLQAKDEAASTYGNRLIDKIFADDEQMLNNIAWANVGPEAKENGLKFDIKLGLKAAIRANDLTKGENAPILDTLAKATFDNGDPKKALEIQEKAVKMMTGDGLDEMKDRLAQYRKAVEAEKKP